MKDLFINKAEELVPPLYKKEILPLGTVNIVSDANYHLGCKSVASNDKDKVFTNGDEIIWDFGNHCVGYLNFHIEVLHNPADAPVKLEITFGEVPYEIFCNNAEYTGILSSSWIQTEILVVDTIPSIVRLNRRYAFRYVKVKVLAISRNYSIKISDIRVTTVTSANEHNLKELPENTDSQLIEIDRICAQTLKNCMQTVYEDGPKRDRRLWMGDLRLQALTDYYLFKNYDLVKRCLYLFSGLRSASERVVACIYEKPNLCADNIMLMDYSLMFNVALFDYFEATNDLETSKELFPIAMKQIYALRNELDKDSIIIKQEGWWAFIDWCDDLQKVTSMQGLSIYAVDRTARLAKSIGMNTQYNELIKIVDDMRTASIKHLFNKEEGLFINKYDNYQLSISSQVWMILADVVDRSVGIEIIKNIEKNKDAKCLVTPYMHHYFVECLFHLGIIEDAVNYIKAYWGDMVKKGADSFWEVYCPDDEWLSPYNDVMIHSFCHAWSCTPSYFIRKWYDEIRSIPAKS